MTEVYFIISLIALTDGVILYSKYLFQKPNKLDEELKSVIVIAPDYWDSLVLPFIFVFPFVWLQVWTQSRKELYLLPFIIITILTFISLILLLRHRFKKYYFTDTKIVILNLFTKKYSSISTSEIQSYIYRPRGYRSNPSYLVVTENKRINLSVRQIKNTELFKSYFKKQNVPYYEYDRLTGNSYRK